jgi:pimeloyl-ACP methyl ester carboxylesterase
VSLHQQTGTADQQQRPQAESAKAPAAQGPGVQAIQAVLRAGNTAVDHIVLLVRAHRAERDAMLELLHQTLGNGFVSQVLAQVGAGDHDAEAKKNWETTPKLEQLQNAPLLEADRTRMRGDILNEHLAHSLAYRDAAELTDDDRRYLTEQGLQVGQVIHGVGGLDMTTFVPMPGKSGPPVLAFRGTKGMTDLVADANPAGVGAYQMSANEGLIAQTLASLATYGPPTLTGHSLGGALAQMTASRFAGQVGRVVTFQSPGIPKDMVDKLDAHNREAEAKGTKPVESTHYAVNGDMVPMAGEAFTAGFLFVIDRGPDPIMDSPVNGIGVALGDHGAHPLQEYLQSGEGTGKWAAGASRYDGRGPASAYEGSTEKRWGGAAAGMHHFTEALRVGVGRAIETVERIGHLGSSPTQAYIAMWEHVRAAIDAKQPPDQIAALINGSKIRPVDKQMMIDNLKKIEASKR